MRALPHIQKAEAGLLKMQISNVLGSTDPRLIEKVLKLDLGIEYPPMPDYEIRGKEGMMRERKSTD